jgi:hypothetical protein
MNLADAGRASLLGWLTVTNSTSSAIENADTSIVAGALQRLDETRAEPIEGDAFWANCWPRGSTKTGTSREERRRVEQSQVRRLDAAAPAPVAEAFADDDERIVVTGSRIARLEQLGDYKLYRTPEPTSVSAHQTKQVAFLEKEEIDYAKRYVFDIHSPDEFYYAGEQESEPWPAQVELRIDNSRKGKLALPLPEGNVRAFADDGERTYFLGEHRLPDLAVDLPVKARIAEATDVQMQTRVLGKEEKQLKGEAVRRRISLEHTITNAGAEAALVEISLGRNLAAAVQIDRASSRMVKTERVPTWLLTVEPESSVTLAYRATWVDEF